MCHLSLKVGLVACVSPPPAAVPHLDGRLVSFGSFAVSDLRLVCLVRAILNSKFQQQFLNHEPPKDAVKWLSLLTRGLLRITTHETLSSTGKAISLHLLAVRGLGILTVQNC